MGFPACQLRAQSKEEAAFVLCVSPNQTSLNAQKAGTRDEEKPQSSFRRLQFDEVDE